MSKKKQNAEKNIAKAAAERAKIEQRRYEDEALYKMLIAFGVALVIEIGLIAIYRQYYSGNRLLEPIRIAMLAMSGVSAVMLVIFIAAKIAKRRKLVGFSAATGTVGLLLAGQAFIYLRVGISAIKAGCVAFPILLLVFVVYLIYQREFFVITLNCTLGVFAVMYSRLMYYRDYSARNDAIYVVVALTVLMAAITVVAMTQKGVIRLGDRKLRLFRTRTSYPMLYISYALVTLLCILYSFFDPGAFFGVMVAFGIFAFVAAIYHTVRLM